MERFGSNRNQVWGLLLSLHSTTDPNPKRKEVVALYRTVIIEDDAVITQLNKRYVEKDSRFQVVRTFSAAHPALFWLRSNPVDLIILDVYMPQMSGLELLRALRAEGVDADVIMVTSANDAATIEAFMRLGVADYLIKPLDR